MEIVAERFAPWPEPQCEFRRTVGCGLRFVEIISIPSPVFVGHTRKFVYVCVCDVFMYLCVCTVERKRSLRGRGTYSHHFSTLEQVRCATRRWRAAHQPEHDTLFPQRHFLWSWFRFRFVFFSFFGRGFIFCFFDIYVKVFYAVNIVCSRIYTLPRSRSGSRLSMTATAQ